MQHLWKLVSSLQDGKVAAFDEIYEKTNRSMFFVAFSILKNKEDSEEVLQELYVKFYKNIEFFTKDKNIYNWLYTVTKNLSINKYKQNSKFTQLDFEENVNDENVDLYSDLNYKNIMNLALKILSEDEFQVITLCLIKGYKRREVSEILNKPIPTITWMYNNALKKLKERLKGGQNEKD